MGNNIFIQKEERTDEIKVIHVNIWYKMIKLDMKYNKSSGSSQSCNEYSIKSKFMKSMYIDRMAFFQFS